MKRYVLLEHGNIVDTKDRPLFHIEENTLWHNSMLQGAILNQSDNLIDLAEVGDMVEDEEISQVINIFKTDNGYKIIITNTKTFETKLGCPTIKAIWKRNGDVMRRYER